MSTEPRVVVMEIDEVGVDECIVGVEEETVEGDIDVTMKIGTVKGKVTGVSIDFLG